ncbi:hypothetical protein N7536_008291 [Penicillium majusculum]|nr:hypothetical protein N7536_008291 [Penicillium majusculum]
MNADGVQQPRSGYRLLLMIWFSLFVAGGLFLYGWTAYYKVHWVVPILGTSLIGFGAFFVIAAASAFGANNLIRYNFSIFLSIVRSAMYSSPTYRWGNSLLGFIALAFVLAPFLLKYGERLRTNAST